MLYGAVEPGAHVMDFGTKFSDKPASERSVDNGSLRRVIKGGDAMLLSPGGFPDAQLRSGSLVFEDERNMLSFSSAVGAGDEKTAKNAAFQSYCPESAGLGIARTLNSANMHVPFAGATQLFTQSQWFELEQQALIYKYIAANVSVPSNLITPIRKSFNPWALSASILANGSLSSTSYGWGPFHLGFPGSTDPEPGRCRRTDGKKWRCAKDATHGHKYCEKHLNRGRHRSRKPVEGQKPDHSVTGATSFAKVAPLASSLSKTSEVASRSGALALAVPLHQSKRSHSTLNPFADSLTRRTHDDLHGISVLSPMISLDSKDALFSVPKPKDPFEESYQSAFGNISSDYLQNPYQTMSSSSLNSKGFPSSFMGINDQESQDQQPLRQFVEDWPKERSEHSTISWQEEAKPDWTKLSMSIPVASSGFSSSTSSPKNEKLALSPLRLGLEFSEREMGFKVFNESQYHKEPTYLPSSPWGSSTGGPLGEVLKISSTQQPLGINENPSALNLMKSQGWDSGKAPIEPSPTGVLLKSTFGSLSTSSSGSSPKVESKVPCSTTVSSLLLP